jgi:hypothetical protein
MRISFASSNLSGSPDPPSVTCEPALPAEEQIAIEA